MMIMGWCTVQTNEYDLQTKTYPIICIHHNLHNNNETNSRFSRNVYAIGDRIWCNKHIRHTTTEKYDNNGKVGYFRFDYDYKMSYRYIFSITYTGMGQLNTYNSIYCNENKRLSIELAACLTPTHKILYKHYMYSVPVSFFLYFQLRL